MTKKHERKKRELLKALALNGPSTKWDLAGEVQGVKKKGLTLFSWSLVHKLIKELTKERLVRKAGKAKGERHESGLFGLTSSALKYLWLEDKEISDNWGKIRKNYSKIIDASEIEWMDFSYRTYQNSDLRRVLHPYYRHPAHPTLLDRDEILNDIINLPAMVKNQSERLKIAREIAGLAAPYPHVRKEVKEHLRSVLDEAEIVREILRNL
jgi:hypothetical protein